MGFFTNLISSFKVNIRCDLSRSVFFPGNIIEGVVIVQANSPIDFRAIRLKLCGKQRSCIARTHTTTRTVNGKPESHTHTEYHVETAVVFKQLITLAGNMKFTGWGGTSHHNMPAGTFYYPFSFQLPNDLPPSVSRRQGGHSSEIYYCVKAYVDIPMGRDAVTKSFFTVLRPMPLAQWLQHSAVNFENNFHVKCCCCIDKGYVKARIFMDRTTIAIDRDNLIVFAEIDNSEGKEPVRALNVDLRGVMRFRAYSHHEQFAWNQAHVSIKKEVPAGGRGVISGVITLERTATPTFSSPLCDVSYSIIAELDIPMASNPHTSFPVVVGQSVDESNFSPPIVYGGASPYYVFPKRSACPEFYYYPPQQPVYTVNMIPMSPTLGMPPQQFVMAPPTVAPVGVPNAQWCHAGTPFVPTGIKDHHIQSGNNSSTVQFQSGVPQFEMQTTQRGSTSETTHSPIAGDGGYGTLGNSSSPKAADSDKNAYYGTLETHLVTK